MSLSLLLAELTQKGIKLWVEGDQLRVRSPKGMLSSQLREQLAKSKSELLLMLGQNQVNAYELPTIEAAPENRYQPFPLTDIQHAFWVGRSGIFELGNVANHGYYEIEGRDLDVEQLNRALQKLIQRHDMLRAIVLADGQQQVLKEVPPYEIPVLDLRGQDEEIISAEIAAIRQRMSHQVLPIDTFPLFEFRATFLDNNRVRLHISYDLQIFDAWSMFRLSEEWFQLCKHPQMELPKLEVTFRDYVLAERALQDTQLYKKSLDYWLNRLDNFPPAPELPLAVNPSSIKEHHNQRLIGQLDAQIWQNLKQKAQNAGLTASGVLMAAFAEVLTLWSKSPRFTINLALFNRLPLHPQVNDILGDFTSVTLLTVDNSQRESFTNRAMRLQKQLWQDLEHRYVSGVQVTRELARKQGRPPSAIPIVFTSTLGFDAIGQKTSMFSQFGEVVYGISQASQVWLDHQVVEENGALLFNWDAIAELFPEGMLEDMFETYCRFLEQLATTDSVWEQTNRQLIPTWQLSQREAINDTAMSIPDETLYSLFVKQVEKYPHNFAVTSSQRNLTYEELYGLSQELGARLQDLGVTCNQLVAVVMEKGWEQIVAVLGILAAGAAYVPIDPGLPQERLLYLLENSQVEIVLTQSWLNQNLNIPENIQAFTVDTFRRDMSRPYKTDTFRRDMSRLYTSDTLPDDLAYVIYTSGSTGLPKGVMITHRKIVNAIVSTNQRFNITSQDRILALSALNHDLSVFDIFGLLSAGGTIVLPDAVTVKDPHHWAELMLHQQVTLWNSVPAMMEMLVDTLENKSINLPKSLRVVTMGGDWLPINLPGRIKALASESETLKILSVGGPTETTLWNICYLIEEVEPTWKSIPYGQPMANSQYYILNQTLENCPVWVPGEMYCAGIQLAKGYWRDREKTNAKFITHPDTGERLYGTGDLGRYLPDGNIEFLGRVDFQIKIRGYRIEAGEIEAALVQHPDIRSAVVAAFGHENHKENLIAYVVTEKQIIPNTEEIRQFLSEKLPEYMLPSIFMRIDALPLSANGKVNRLALPNPEKAVRELNVNYVAPETEIEQTISQIIQDILEVEKVGINDNFFELGANSLSLTKIFNRLQNKLPNEIQSISLVDLFKYSTIKSLASYLNQSQINSDTSNKLTDREEQMKAGKNRRNKRLQKSKITN